MKSCLILLALLSTSYALKCQVCGIEGSGICENADDNGVSKECPPEAKACWYGYGSNPEEPPEYQEMTVRKCAEGYDINACQSWTIDQVYAQMCTCTEDNCNTSRDCLYTCPLNN